MRRALVVEDDPDIVELVTHYLAKEGWGVDSTSDGRVALDRLRTKPHDLVLLDLQIPGMDGLAVCRELRAEEATRRLPVIMITARGHESERILGLETGADDYVVKPFSPKELLARVRALFRRIDAVPEGDGPLRLGPLVLDRARHTVRWADQPVRLTAKEFSLLAALAEAKGRVLSRQALLENVWGYSYAEGTRTVDVHVRRLRAKIPGLGRLLITVKSLGYRLTADPDR